MSGEGLDQQLARLEQRLEQLERQLADERAAELRRRQRERWLRIGLLGLIVLFYVLYWRSVTDIL